MRLVYLRCRKFKFLGFLLWGSSLVVYAQQQPVSNHEKQIKQGIDRINNQLDPLLEGQDVFLQDLYGVEQQLAETDATETCFTILNIDVEGVSLIDAPSMASVTLPYQDQCLGLNQINNLVAAISNLYLEKGLVTSRAYIKPQDLSDGTLSIFVLEGVVESIQSDDGDLSARQLAFAFPTEVQEVLDLRELEQGLENLNRLGQNRATLSLLPGIQQGGTIVNIQNQRSKRWRGSVGINNTGVEDTGEYQLDANFIYDNLLGLNDSLITSVSSNIGSHKLPQAKSRSYSLVNSIPYDYWLFNINSNYFEYEQSVLGSSTDFLTSGSSFNTSISADHLFYRGQADKLNFAVSFTRKESRNFIEDVFLDTSSRTLYVWDLASHYVLHLPFGSLNTAFHINKSVAWFDAKTELAEAEDDFQFTKYLLDLGFSSRFQLGMQTVLYSSNLHLLYSPKTILASEGLTVGGRYSVRGLSQSSLFGYRGAYIRNDFTLPFETSWPVLQRLDVLLGLDAGSTNLPEFDDKNSDWVAGANLSLRLYDEKFTVTLSYARALRVPDFLNAQRQELDFSVRFNF